MNTRMPFVANWYGNDTAKQSGRLTLNLLQLSFGTLYPFSKYNMLPVKFGKTLWSG
jgi:hypothetical protein